MKPKMLNLSMAMLTLMMVVGLLPVNAANNDFNIDSNNKSDNRFDDRFDNDKNNNGNHYGNNDLSGYEKQFEKYFNNLNSNLDMFSREVSNSNGVFANLNAEVKGEINVTINNYNSDLDELKAEYTSEINAATRNDQKVRIYKKYKDELEELSVNFYNDLKAHVNNNNSILTWLKVRNNLLVKVYTGTPSTGTGSTNTGTTSTGTHEELVTKINNFRSNLTLYGDEVNRNGGAFMNLRAIVKNQVTSSVNNYKDKLDTLEDEYLDEANTPKTSDERDELFDEFDEKIEDLASEFFNEVKNIVKSNSKALAWVNARSNLTSQVYTSGGNTGTGNTSTGTSQEIVKMFDTFEKNLTLYGNEVNRNGGAFMNLNSTLKGNITSSVNEYKDDLNTLEDEYLEGANTPMTYSQRNQFNVETKTELQTLANSFYAEIEDIVENDSRARTWVQARNELTVKVYTTSTTDYYNQYNTALRNMLERIAILYPERLIIAMQRVDNLIASYEANEQINGVLKEKLILQLTAIRDVIEDVINSVLG